MTEEDDTPPMIEHDCDTQEEAQEAKPIKREVGEIMRLSHKGLGIDVELGSTLFTVEQLCNIGLQVFERLSNGKKKECSYV